MHPQKYKKRHTREQARECYRVVFLCAKMRKKRANSTRCFHPISSCPFVYASTHTQTGVSPTLLLTKGVEYVLEQMWNVTNWMHPLGFAYYPDGAHGWLDNAELPELESPTPDLCDLPQFQCNPGEGILQAPLYDVNGKMDSLDNWNDEASGAGLDVYEPMFQVCAHHLPYPSLSHSLRLLVSHENTSRWHTR